MTRLDRLRSGLALLWEVPLGLASFAFNKGVRGLLRRLANRHYSRREGEARSWRAMSAETLRKRIALPLVMTSAPRWNTHAVVATAGPIPVRESLEVDAAAAGRSARTWVVVVYTFPAFRTVARVDAKGPGPVRLGPGRYWLGLRYYHWSADLELPAVSADGTPAVPALPLSPDVNDFYDDLRDRGGWFYLGLHYYVYVLLRWRDWLPRSFVEREFLPVGNPDTGFRYGALGRGEALSLELRPELLDAADVYLTLYNRASFPVFWGPVATTEYVTAPCAKPCSYLLRVQKKPEGAAEVPEEWIRVSVV